MIKDIVFDMLLVENQLPMFILQDLFMLARHDLPNTFKNYSLCQFINIFSQVVYQRIYPNDSIGCCVSFRDLL